VTVTARYEQHWRRLWLYRDASRHLGAGHHRHGNVRDHQMDPGRAFFEKSEGFQAIPRDKHPVPISRHHPPHVIAQWLLVVHHQDGELRRLGGRHHRRLLLRRGLI
jgi:hypothetical protein